MKNIHSFWKYLLLFFGFIAIIWFVIFIIPVKERQEHVFYNPDRPIIIAHQGGEHLAPSGTLEAFINAKELGVDVIEFDVHMTSDGHLVSIHDPAVDRTTNGTGTINNMTLKEVQALDAGDYFMDLEGNYSFRNKGVYIPTVEEVFATVPDMNYIIEIKDTNDTTLIEAIATKLWELIKKEKLERSVLLASFDHDVIDTVDKVTGKEALVGGGRQEIKRFVIFHKLFLNGLYKNKIDAIQIPREDDGVNLKDRKLIKGANKRGIGVHYWTINDKESMKELIDLGANGIITDRPDLMIDLLKKVE